MRRASVLIRFRELGFDWSTASSIISEEYAISTERVRGRGFTTFGLTVEMHSL
jgi:hypothetical protein